MGRQSRTSHAVKLPHAFRAGQHHHKWAHGRFYLPGSQDINERWDSHQFSDHLEIEGGNRPEEYPKGTEIIVEEWDIEWHKVYAFFAMLICVFFLELAWVWHRP